jgi:hypothetical protein
MNDDRWFCQLSPCNPDRSARPDIAGALSFATSEAYERHLRNGHFLEPGAPGVPEPFIAPLVSRRRVA